MSGHRMLNGTFSSTTGNKVNKIELKSQSVITASIVIEKSKIGVHTYNSRLLCYMKQYLLYYNGLGLAVQYGYKYGVKYA